MPRTSFLWLALPIAVSTPFIATGCGGSDSQTTDSKIAIQDYQKKYDDALCAHLVKCGDQPDAASCKRTQAPDPDVAQAIASVVYGSLGFDGGAAINCVNAIKAAGCELPPSVGGVSKDAATTCDKVFTNRHANGGSCFSGIECTSGKCKPPMACTDSCCLGTCDDVGDAIPLDGDCGGMTPKKCTLGTYCQMGTSKCVKLKDSNEACDQLDACLPGLACDVGGAGVCFQAAKSDSQCNPKLNVNPCAAYNEWCDPNASKCVPLPGPGAPCTTGNKCIGDAFCSNGTCTARPIEGETCAANTGCLGSMTCSDPKNGGKCLPFDGETTCVPPQ